MKGKYSSLPTGEYDEDSHYYTSSNRGNGHHHARQAYKQSLKKQDENLDILGDSVSRLGEMSLNISKEIELQNRMLSSLESDIDSASDKASALIKQTKELVKKSGGPKWCALIVVLSVILIILTFFVIYT